MMSPLCALVTGVGGRSVGHQILQALLAVAPKYRIVACDCDAFAYGLFLVDCRYRVPRADSPAYLDSLLKLVETEKVDVVLPGTEAEVLVLAANAALFEEKDCRVITNPESVVTLCKNKGRLYAWLAERGIGVPESAPASQWRELASSVGYPLVGKPAELSGASRHVALLNTEAEVEQYLSSLPVNVEVVFQQYVDGAESEYTVGVLISDRGGIIDSIVVQRKLVGLSLGTERYLEGHRYALSTGYSQGFIIKHSFLQSQCEALALRIGARGPLNVQCRIADGKVYVFEVHPRFSGTSSIRAAVGFNEPDVLIRSLVLGEQFGRLSYRTNMAAIRAFSNLIVPIDEIEAVAGIDEEESC
jgi:carbamoyl-phosphate synthase large subunit